MTCANAPRASPSFALFHHLASSSTLLERARSVSASDSIQRFPDVRASGPWRVDESLPLLDPNRKSFRPPTDGALRGRRARLVAVRSRTVSRASVGSFFCNLARDEDPPHLFQPLEAVPFFAQDPRSLLRLPAPDPSQSSRARPRNPDTSILAPLHSLRTPSRLLST